MIGLAIPYFQIDPEGGVYENSQLATFMGVGFLVLLFAIVDLLAYGVTNRQKILKDPNSPFYFRKGERYWKIPLAEALYGALRGLPSYDTYLSIAALALSLLAYGLYLALPALASSPLLAFVALLDLGFMGLRIFPSPRYPRTSLSFGGSRKAGLRFL